MSRHGSRHESLIERIAPDVVRVGIIGLRPGQLVVRENTTYPRTTRDVVLPVLAVDFFLAFSP